MRRSFYKKLQDAVAAWAITSSRSERVAPLTADESFFEFLVQNANSIIMITEMHTSRTLFANRFALDFFGYTEKELIGRPAVGTIIPEQEQSGRDLEAMVAGLYRQPEMFLTNENENRRKNGERVWVAWTNRALLNTEGEFVGLLSIGNDITRRVRAEERARRYDTNYRTIFNQATDAVFITDFDGQPLDVNQAACDMYGYTREEMLNISPKELVAPESQVDRQDRLDAIKQGDAHLEMTSLRKDGTRFDVEYNSSQVDFEGRTAVLHIVRDVTRRKRAEEELRRAESYYRMIFDNSSDPICLINETGMILDINRAAMDVYGYSQADFLNMNVRDLAQPDHASEVPGRIDRILGEGYLAHETAHRKKDGRVIYLDVRSTRVNHEGKPAILVVAHDITERRERERQLSEFLSIASHELSLPVTIVKGYTQTLENHLTDLSPEALAQILESIRNAADRLNALVEELLDVTRIETGRLSLKKETLDLEPLLLDTVKEIQFKRTDHLFSVEIISGSDSVEGDPVRIAQVLMILMDNAARFSPENSVIEIQAAPLDGAGIALSVIDRGMGVPEADRERIFEPFSQVEDVEHHGNSGLGMGLYIAREIVRGHSGEIWCEERPGGGSVFRFSLPAA